MGRPIAADRRSCRYTTEPTAVVLTPADVVVAPAKSTRRCSRCTLWAGSETGKDVAGGVFLVMMAGQGQVLAKLRDRTLLLVPRSVDG